MPWDLWKSLHKSSGRRRQTHHTETSRTCFLCKTAFSIVCGTTFFCSLEYYIWVNARTSVNAGFSFASSYLTRKLMLFLWITELLFTKTTLNNMLCKTKRAHCKILYLAYKQYKYTGAQGRQQGPISLGSKLIILRHWNLLSTVGLSYFIDTAVKGKTGNKKCSFYKLCCLETLYF